MKTKLFLISFIAGLLGVVTGFYIKSAKEYLGFDYSGLKLSKQQRQKLSELKKRYKEEMTKAKILTTKEFINCCHEYISKNDESVFDFYLIKYHDEMHERIEFLKEFLKTLDENQKKVFIEKICKKACRLAKTDSCICGHH